MKLYYAPGACSLSPHIALIEAGFAHDLVKVDTKTRQFDGGGDFLAVNSKGYVPVLELDDGQRLTEGPAIVQYIADRKPESGLAPKPGTLERVRVQEWLNFTTSEIHKGFSPLFYADTPEDYKAIVRARLGKRFDWLATQLEGKTYLLGETFTVADAYLFTVINWTMATPPIELAKWPNVKAYCERLRQRPSIAKAVAEEFELYKAEQARKKAAA